MERADRGVAAASWDRFAPLAGIAAVVLWVIGAALLFSNEPGDPNPEEIARYYRENEASILAGSWIFATGVLLFLWFLSALRAHFVALEGLAGQLSALAFGAGVGVAIFLLGLPGTNATGAFEGNQITTGAAEALWTMTGVFFGGAELMAVVLLAAAGVLILRTGALPRWWGWITLVVALWLFIIPIGWAGMLLGFPLWVLITSVLLLRSRQTAAGDATATESRATV